MKLFAWILLFTNLSSAQLPTQPTDAAHPGSAAYPFTLQQEKLKINNRSVDIFLPQEAKSSGKKVPVIVFGHGQAIDVLGYELTFKHLARKGIAVIHPTFDSGFFDQDWHRMADDFNELTASALTKYSDYLDSSKVIYSGHSKGGYVSLVAAGSASLNRFGIKISSLIYFAPAGYDKAYLNNIDPNIPVTLVWSDSDSIIKQNAIVEIYNNLPSKKKQWILAKSYDSLKADHFFVLNKSYFFGGQNGVTAYHYFAIWKWLIGAAFSNSYLYGPEAMDTGVLGLNHQITHN